MRQRDSQRVKLVNRIDPVFIFLDRIVFKMLFEPPKLNSPNEFEKLEISEIDFLLENMNKHRVIIWINCLLATFLFSSGLESIMNFGNESIVVTGLLAPAMITGAAWFAVSFGGIPEKFIGIAYYLTMAMFLSFTLSMTLLTCLLIDITPSVIGYFVILPIYLSLYLASVLYDNVDGLKIGLDSTLLKFSRANLNYYQKHGLITKRETQKETFVDDAVSSGEIALFTYYLRNLERNLNQLEEEKALIVANHLIILSTDILFNIIKNFRPDTKVDLGKEYDDYYHSGHRLDQDEVDELTIKYLKQIVSLLEGILKDDHASIELGKIAMKLQDFSESKTKDQQGVINQEEGRKVDKQGKREAQSFADHIFSQSFRQLLELTSAYRHVLFDRSGD